MGQKAWPGSQGAAIPDQPSSGNVASFTPQLLLDFFYSVVGVGGQDLVLTARDPEGGCQPQYLRADHCQRRLRPAARLADHRIRLAFYAWMLYATLRKDQRA